MAERVNEQSKLSKALSLHPAVLDYIVGLNPHDFVRLRNPLMRQLMSPRITLARVARMTGTPILDLLAGIHTAAGTPLDEDDRQRIIDRHVERPEMPLPTNLGERPKWSLAEPAAYVDLLASDERLDTDPMPPIFRALQQVVPGAVVLVKHKWEPQPLYDLWAKRGIAYYAHQISEDQWWIYLRKPSTLDHE